MKIYVYTKKGEARAREMKLDERKEGETAYCGNKPLHECPFDVQTGWLNRGYVQEKEI